MQIVFSFQHMILKSYPKEWAFKFLAALPGNGERPQVTANAPRNGERPFGNGKRLLVTANVAW